MTSEEFKNEAERLRSWLAHVARRYMPDDDSAEDIVQETLVRLWRQHRQLHHPIQPWAKTVLRNIAIDELRKKKKTVPLNNDVDIGTDNGDEYNADRVERMMKIVANLPEQQQRILTLRHLEGLDMKSLAAEAGANEAAVRQQLSRARRAVRDQYLKKYRQL
ncbi:MAG: sigma-70 family RNA polymerase sigma factor [Bacteroidaceae bacterium]|nr:sigma-70 family RNA polymerase sigma factor [Bacteroidaceae bacterium]